MPDYPIPIPRFRTDTVRLSCINSEDHTCQISTDTHLDSLTRSIRNVGLIQPPLLIHSESDTPHPKSFIIVCGFRRIASYRDIGIPDIEAKILEPDTTGLDCIKFAITDNALQRPLNLIEMSRAFHKLSEFFKNGHHDLYKVAAPLGLPENPSVIKKIKKLCLLPQIIQNGILSNTISLPVALEMGKLEPDEGIEFARLFENLKLSLNKQREIITLIREITFREDMSILQVFQEPSFQDILSNKESDRNQKTRALRFYLKQRRFPSITYAEQTYEKHLKSLNIGNSAKLIPPNNFEGTTYALNLRFQNLEELEAHRATLDKMISNPSLEKLLIKQVFDSSLKSPNSDLQIP